MANLRRSNWADISDSDSSDEVIVQPSKPKEKEESVRQVSQLERQLQFLSPPIIFMLGNLKYSIVNAKPLYDFFGLSQDDCEIQVSFKNNVPSGSAIMTVHTLEIANKVASFDNKYLQTRPIRISVRKSAAEHSRVPRRGGRGNRGGGGRGRNHNNYQNNYFNEPSKKSILHGEKNEDRPVQRANPFGDAKPIDTSKKDLEFEMKIHSQKSEEVTEGHCHVWKTQPIRVNQQQLPEEQVVTENGNGNLIAETVANANPENLLKLEEPFEEIAEEHLKVIAEEPLKEIAEEPFKEIAEEPLKEIAEESQKSPKNDDRKTPKDNKNLLIKEANEQEEIKETPRSNANKNKRKDFEKKREKRIRRNQRKKEERRKEIEEAKQKEEEIKDTGHEETKEPRIQRAWTDYDTTVDILSGTPASTPTLEKNPSQQSTTHTRKRKNKKHFNRKKNA